MPAEPRVQKYKPADRKNLRGDRLSMSQETDKPVLRRGSYIVNVVQISSLYDSAHGWSVEGGYSRGSPNDHKVTLPQRVEVADIEPMSILEE
jgi:hypothetical protein